MKLISPFVEIFPLYDNSTLTALMLCCCAAEVQVDILGSFKHYTHLRFYPTERAYELPQRAALPSSEIFAPEKNLSAGTGLDVFASSFCSIRSELQHFQGGYICLIAPLKREELCPLVVNAHHHCIRVALVGRSPYTLEAQFHQRQREGKTFASRHSSMEVHLEALRGLFDIDYLSKT